MFVTIRGGEINQKEQQAYIDRGYQMYGDRLKGVEINVDGDYVDLAYTVRQIPFERIRRITGYLVGTMDRWNNAKKAEEKDRVKHEA